MQMQINFTNTMKMDDFFGDLETFLDNQSIMDDGSFYNEYLDLFKLNKRQNFFMNYNTDGATSGGMCHF